MKSSWILILAALTSTLAWAQAPASPDREQLRQRLREATEAQVELPRTPPALPDRASEQARLAHQDTAFGKKGQEMRAAAQEARRRGQRDAEHAGRHPERRHRGMEQGDVVRGNRDHARAKDHARNQESRGHGSMGGMPGSGGGMGGGGMGGGMGGTTGTESGPRR